LGSGNPTHFRDLGNRQEKTGDYPDFQILKVFENPWGLEIRRIFEIWAIVRKKLLTRQHYFDIVVVESPFM
jgi:hypothetical protein